MANSYKIIISMFKNTEKSGGTENAGVENAGVEKQ